MELDLVVRFLVVPLERHLLCAVVVVAVLHPRKEAIDRVQSEFLVPRAVSVRAERTT